MSKWQHFRETFSPLFGFIGIIVGLAYLLSLLVFGWQLGMYISSGFRDLPNGDIISLAHAIYAAGFEQTGIYIWAISQKIPLFLAESHIFIGICGPFGVLISVVYTLDKLYG